MDETYIQFDRIKFKAAVLYVCSKLSPQEFGNVKLHKILYFADMLKFRDTGTPMTGVDYVKQKFGPTARHLTSVLEELASEGAIRIERRDYHGFEKKDYVALMTVDRSSLGNKNVEILDNVIEFAKGRTATELSELSHDEAWHAADLGERIPYAAVFGWEPIEYTDDDRETALNEVRRIRPLIEQERRESRVL